MGTVDFGRPSGVHMNEENPFRLFGALRLDSQDGQGLRMVGSEPASPIERRAQRSSAPADRGDAPTKQQFMTAVDEHAAAARAWNGRGPEVDEKRAAIARLLYLAGVV